MPFLEEITARLVSQSVGVSTPGLSSTNIFTSSAAAIPTGQGPYLTVSETGGSGASLTQTDTATEHPTAQITVRAAAYPVARAMARAAYLALGGPNGLHNVTLSGVYYLHIRARQNLTDLGLDADSRPMVGFNIEAEKQPS